MTLLVDRPKTMPGPPVARQTASAGKARICIDLTSCTTMPRVTPSSSCTSERKSQNSNFRTMRSPGTGALVVLVVDGLEAPHLLVQRVKELLAGGRAREGRPVEERAAEAPEVEQPLRRAVEGDAHAVEHEDDAGRGVGHPLDGGLVGEEIAAVDGLFEVNLRGVPLALRVDARVDAPLRADGVRALHRDEREEVDRDARFAELDRRHEAGEAPSDDGDAPDLPGRTERDAFGGHLESLRERAMQTRRAERRARGLVRPG